MLPDLRRDRWLWSDRAVDWLTTELYGAGTSAPDTGGTNVLLVGKTRTGKTTLRLHLLGVTDPEQVRTTHRVLAGGRQGSESNTAAPTQYRWSLSADRWTLVRDAHSAPELLTGEQLGHELARLRAGDTVLWDVGARPLEIGLPTRLAAGGARRELRILDLPGTFARDRQEQLIAQQLVARFAPRMAVVLFVLKADDMTSLSHEEITGDPYLQSWAGDPGRFRLVLTSSFEDRSLRRDLLRATRRAGPEAVAAELRGQLAEQLADTVLEDPARAEQLVPLLYPVDLGRSWGKLSPTEAAALRPARDLVVEQLATSLTAANQPDSDRLGTPRLALRVAEQLRAQAYAREAARGALTAELAKVTAERDRHRELREAAAAAATAAQTELLIFTTALEDLAARPVGYRRPAPPDFKQAATVRAGQEKERAAWTAAARQLWDGWRADHPRLRMRRSMPLDEAEIRLRYDETVGCCQHCGDFRATMLIPFFGVIPAVKAGNAPRNKCYRQMTEAGDPMARWLTDRMTAAVRRAMAPAVTAEAAATERLNTVERVYDRTFRRAGELTRELDRMRRDHAAADEAAAAQLATAGKLRMVLDQENQAYVGHLARAVQQAPTAERGWYAAAALRAVLDLNLMLTAD